jgi:two-component system cell cycle response regulator
VTDLVRPHLLLAGDPVARPEGLEQFLVRGGFLVDSIPEDLAPLRAAERESADAVVLCGRAADAGILETVGVFRASAEWSDIPLVVTLVTGGSEAVAALIGAGANDALAAPVDLGELRARLDRLLEVRRYLREVRETLRSRDLLFDIFQEVSAALRAEEIFQTLVRRVGQALGLAHCSFVLTSPGEAFGRVVAVYEDPSVRDLRVELSRYPEIEEALRTERPVVVQNVMEHPLFAQVRERWAAQSVDVNVRCAVALPVFVQGTPAGVFFLRTSEGDRELSTRDVALADTIAQAAAKVLENEDRRAAIYRRQVNAGALDQLTGVASLDALDRRLKDEFERARRYRLRFSLVVVDVDRFRDVNEKLGNAAGDRVLSDLGHLLHRELRAPDFVARYGGDEFALVLPETDARGARNFVQRLRSLIAKHSFPDLVGAVPAISAGIVTFPHPEVLRAEDLFQLAESALAAAKGGAPDRIAVALASSA